MIARVQASWLAVLVLGACLRAPGYRCDNDVQCVRAPGGVCEADACAYPDAMCDGVGLRWDAYAPDELANACVGGGAEGEGSGEDGPPTSRCGDGTVDAHEDCDDGNREPDDGCHPQCVAPGTVLWTVTHDGPAHSEDKGYGVVLDPASASFYVVGFITETATDGTDILLQRRWIEDGGLQWSRSHGGDGRGDDTGENVVVDPDGNAVICGTAIGETTDGDLFARSYDPEGRPRWTFTHDEMGEFDLAQGIGITSIGTLVVVGNVGIVREGASVPDNDAWIGRFDTEGTLLAAPLLRGGSAWGDQAIDADGDGDGWLVTGRLADDDGQSRVWTARYDRQGALLWEDLATADPLGNESRGVGMGLDREGGSATAGVLSNDIWVRRYDAFGTIGTTIEVDGPAAIHDEAADVAFARNGSFVVVGFIDFATDGFATGDAWVRKYGADGTEQWSDVYDGPAHEIDKALAVVVADDDSAIVVGYETVPGQARDVWIRRYAI